MDPRKPPSRGRKVRDFRASLSASDVMFEKNWRSLQKRVICANLTRLRLNGSSRRLSSARIYVSTVTTKKSCRSPTNSAACAPRERVRWRVGTNPRKLPASTCVTRVIKWSAIHWLIKFVTIAKPRRPRNGQSRRRPSAWICA